MTDDLAAFIKARLDEDEQHARKDLWAIERATAQGQWEARYGYNYPHSYLRAGDAEVAVFSSRRASPPLADGEEDLHAADVLLAGRMVRAAKPRAERMLREVEAKRAILARYGEYSGTNIGEHLQWSQEQQGLYRAMCALAAVWSDHPDYRAEWRP